MSMTGIRFCGIMTHCWKINWKTYTDVDLLSQWMLDGDWEKGATKSDISCIKKEAIRETSV